MKRKLHIDGTTETGEYMGGAKRAPYAIFDEARQSWLVSGLRYRWQARLLLALILAWEGASE